MIIIFYYFLFLASSAPKNAVHQDSERFIQAIHLAPGTKNIITYRRLTNNDN